MQQRVSLLDMQTIHIKKGLDLPLVGGPEQVVYDGPAITQVALIGDDYIGLKPTLEVGVGERVKCGQTLFTDKKNPGVCFTAPGSGQVVAINRGAKRKFQAIVIELSGDEGINFPALNDRPPSDIPSAEIRENLINSGLWTAFRTRPFGKIPAINTTPAALFITAIDTRPHAPDPALLIGRNKADFTLGLQILAAFFKGAIHLCVGSADINGDVSGITACKFTGPHPAGLPSTHIHFLSPAHAENVVWHIDYQDVIAIGYLFGNGRLSQTKIISLAGPMVQKPRLVTTHPGASITELVAGQLKEGRVRLLSGSVLDGRSTETDNAWLGRYHNQMSAVCEGGDSSFLGWMQPGGNRFSVLPLFLANFLAKKNFALDTRAWGGHRAIMPLGTYEKVMPLDIIATSLVKALACGNTEKSQDLGGLELIEEDMALCSFVCPGKNDFGVMLRKVLAAIEAGG